MLSNLTEKLLELIEKPAFIANEAGAFIGCNAAFEKFLDINKTQQLSNLGVDFIGAPSASMSYGEDEKRLTSFSKVEFFDERQNVAGYICLIAVPKDYEFTNRLTQKVGRRSVLGLTGRELDVLRLIAKGTSTKAAAKLLGISNHTVGDYLKSIYTKLGANSRITAILEARKHELIKI